MTLDERAYEVACNNARVMGGLEILAAEDPRVTKLGEFIKKADELIADQAKALKEANTRIEALEGALEMYTESNWYTEYDYGSLIIPDCSVHPWDVAKQALQDKQE